MKSVAMIAIHGQRVIIYPGSVIQRPDPGLFFHETVWNVLTPSCQYPLQLK